MRHQEEELLRREPKVLPAAILFDMDGTLTEPLLDFPKIKAEMGIGNQPILEALAQMQPGERLAAEAVLLRHEQEASAQSKLNPGCHELLEWIRGQNIAAALITRNSRQSVETVLQRHRLRIEVVVSRDDSPPKPDPTLLHVACGRLGVEPARVWMVGDGVYDVEAGNAAGIFTLWVSHGRERNFEACPDTEVKNLHEVLQLLKACTRASAGTT